ncbi:MAG: hypothetical protein HY744_07170 [Deltaproteobacteria bacterium]|nr:hypothetical protein [Deltaproteobacteria bacterium]
MSDAYRWGFTPTPPPVALGPRPELPGPAREQGPAGAAARPLSRLVARASAIVFVLVLVAAGLAARALRERASTAVEAALGARPTIERAAGAVIAAQSMRPAPAADPIPVKHAGYEPISGGVLIAPESFAPRGSDYDLVIHFHGDVAIVRESVERARVGAALAVINVGTSSLPYQERFTESASYERLLAEIGRAVAARGLPQPRLRRVALSAWSGGYGAIAAILANHQGDQHLDALLVADGIHSGWVDSGGHKSLNPHIMAPFYEAARAAAAGQILFSLTFSEIEPQGYAGTAEVAADLLASVGATPAARPLLEAPAEVDLEAARHAVPSERRQKLEPLSDSRVGLLHVRGFRGNTKEHHIAHLTQMAATILADLSEHWGSNRTP